MSGSQGSYGAYQPKSYQPTQYPGFDGMPRDVGGGMQMRQMAPSVLPPRFTNTDPSRPLALNSPTQSDSLQPVNKLRFDGSTQPLPGGLAIRQMGPSMPPPKRPMDATASEPYMPPPAGGIGLPVRPPAGDIGQPPANPYAHIPGMSPDGKSWFNPTMGKNVPIHVPEGYELTWDGVAPGMKRASPRNSTVRSINDYGVRTGDGYTGVRNGQNFINGRLFEPEANNMGETGNEVTWAFQNYLSKNGNELGGTARQYADMIRGLPRGAAAPRGLLGSQVPANYWFGNPGFNPGGR
jgi:hypothetical protein